MVNTNILVNRYNHYFLMRKGLFTVLFNFILLATSAQTLTIIDAETNLPIELATVGSSNPNISFTTNSEGQVDISNLKTATSIEIRHVAYQTIRTTYSQLAASDFTLKMMPAKLAINEVVISANKWEQSTYEIPVKIISMEQEAIGYHNPQTSADMLAASGQVFVQKSQYGGGSPKLRGFAANSVLMVIDGVRMNNAIYRSGNLQNIISIDPNSLEGAEVVLGPGSVIYGSDALGGVMDFHTKELHYKTNGQLVISGSTMGRYSTAAKEKTWHGDIHVAGKKLASYTSFSLSSFDDLRAGSNRPEGYDNFGKRLFYVGQDVAGNDIKVANTSTNKQVGSGFDTRSLVNKIGFRPNNNLELGYNLYYSTTSNIPRYDALVETNDLGEPASAEWYYGPQKWWMNAAHAKWVKPASIFDQLKVVLAYQDYEESRIDRRFAGSTRRERTEKVDFYSLNVDVDKDLKNGNLFYGFEVLYNDVQSTGKRTDINTGEVTPTASRYPDGGSDYWSYAGYLNHKWLLNNGFILTSGIRYSHVKLNAKLSDQSALNFPYSELKVDNGALNGSLGLVYSPSRKSKINIAASSGFRSPNVDDIGKVFDFSAGEVQVPNPDLSPEYAYNIESGIETKVGQRFEFGLTGFYTWVIDAMVRQDFTFNGQDSIIFDGELSKVVALTNTGEAYIYGFSAEAEIEIGKYLYFESVITGVYGRDKTNNEPLRHTTPLFGKVSITYSKNKVKASFYSDFNGARLREDIPTSEIDDKPFLYAQHNDNRYKDGSPAWVTFNLRASYELNSALKVGVGLENIFDTHYRPYSSGISAPGRNLAISIRANF